MEQLTLGGKTTEMMLDSGSAVSLVIKQEADNQTARTEQCTYYLPLTTANKSSSWSSAINNIRPITLFG